MSDVTFSIDESLIRKNYLSAIYSLRKIPVVRVTGRYNDLPLEDLAQLASDLNDQVQEYYKILEDSQRLVETIKITCRVHERSVKIQQKKIKRREQIKDKKIPPNMTTDRTFAGEPLRTYTIGNVKHIRENIVASEAPLPVLIGTFLKDKPAQVPIFPVTNVPRKFKNHHAALEAQQNMSEDWLQNQLKLRELNLKSRKKNQLRVVDFLEEEQEEVKDVIHYEPNLDQPTQSIEPTRPPKSRPQTPGNEPIASTPASASTWPPVEISTEDYMTQFQDRESPSNSQPSENLASLLHSDLFTRRDLMGNTPFLDLSSFVQEDSLTPISITQLAPYIDVNNANQEWLENTSVSPLESHLIQQNSADSSYDAVISSTIASSRTGDEHLFYSSEDESD